MDLPHPLKTKIVDFLVSLPTDMNNNNARRAFIEGAGLDLELQNQIEFGGSTAQFCQLLVPTLSRYGRLSDGRNALEAVLETAKGYVGQDKRDYCDTLIQEFHAGQPPEETPYQFPNSHPTSDETELQNLYRDEPKCGIAPREKVFSLEEDLPGQVFNIELLTKPILLRKHRDNIHVFLDRDDVRWGVYSRKGRKKVNELTFLDEAARKKAIQYDKEIHRFLMQGKNDESFLVSLPNLRWASGGVLSIVKFKDRKWVPFFFRDIAPYGWQIPQGASEKKTDDLNDPWSFMIREFLEEVLICHDDEQSPTIIRHPFSFERLKIEKEIQSANELSHKHDTLRFRRDGMQIIAGKPIAATIVPTNTSLEIRHNNKMQPLRHDVLVLFNITELGIEVVKIVRYQLGNNEYILDGEIYDPYGSNQVELLRAPVVLISLDYLRNSFKNMLDYTFTYEFDKDLPSIVAPDIPSKDDIHIFSPDVLRRLEIASGSEQRATKWEKERYTDWKNKFGEYFFDPNNKLISENACPLFTPTAAKVMTYYFAFC